MKKYPPLYFVLVLGLYGTTFIPHTTQWIQWMPWILSHIFLLSIIGGVAVLFAFKSTTNAIGKAAAKLEKIPESFLLGIASLSFFFITYYLSGDLFGNLPTELDSMAQYVGAKIFAEGSWAAESHKLPRFFDNEWFFNDGRFYTFYPPGHMLILAIGHIIGNPAIINPILGSLSLVATYFLTKEIGGTRAARISTVFFLVSPFIIFLASEYDNRTTALLCATTFALFYIKAIKSNRIFYAVISGAALGYLCITRPQTVVPYALPFAVYAVWLLKLNFQVRWKIFAAMVLAMVPFILFFLYYNGQTTGDLFLTGYQKYFGQEVVPGSGFNWATWPQEFTGAVIHMQLLHQQFFGWPVSSLFLAFLLFLFKAQRPFCGLLAASFFCVFFSLTLTPYRYVIFGPRYLYEISSIVVTLTAISITRMPTILRVYGDIKMPHQQWLGLSVVTIATLVFISLNTTVKALYREYGYNYRVGRLEFARLIEKSVQRPALVLIGNPFLYAGLTYRQPPNDKNDIIFAHDRGAENSLIMQYYPERSVYVIYNERQIHRVR